MKELVLKKDEYGFMSNYYGELCSILDEYVNPGFKPVLDRFGRGTYVCDYIESEPKIKLIRFPGATRGNIRLDENDIILSITLYEDAFIGSINCFISNCIVEAQQRVNNYIGYKLVLV